MIKAIFRCLIASIGVLLVGVASMINFVRTLNELRQTTIANILGVPTILVSLFLLLISFIKKALK